MKPQTKSLRSFIGSKHFNISRNFYLDLGFKENIISDSFSYFETGSIGFYLQAAYVKDWIENTMLFLEVENVDNYWEELIAADLLGKYESVRLVPVRQMDWGKECFIHDPSGILWHIGEFNK